MAETLHPVVDAILNGGTHLKRPRVEIFTEHEIKGKDGKVVVVDKARLEKIAKVGNDKAKVGNLSLVGPGHTIDGEFDQNGKLIRPFPQEKQPKPWGVLHNYRVEKNPASKKYSLYVDEHVERLIRNPETGALEDGLKYSASFPRRSAEIYHSACWIDWLAALRTAPELDLELQHYANANPDHVRYANFTSKQPFPVLDSGTSTGLKTRYSAETAAAFDPTDAPTADPDAPADTPPIEADDLAAPDEQAEGELPPEHKEAAEKYSMHSSGMHHTRMAAILQRLHGEHGMEGDMKTPHVPKEKMAMSTPSATGVPPQAAPPPPQKAPEHTQMSKDQEAIEKSRYEARFKALEEKAAAAEARAAAADKESLVSHTHQLAMQMVYEGFPIHAEYEKKICEKGRYSREQVDEHFAELRVLHADKKAPVDNSPPFDMGAHRAYSHPVRGEPTDPNAITEEKRQAIEVVMRKHNLYGMDAFEKAKAIYEKDTNGKTR